MNTPDPEKLIEAMRVWAIWCHVQGIRAEVQRALNDGADQIEKYSGWIDDFISKANQNRIEELEARKAAAEAINKAIAESPAPPQNFPFVDRGP